MPRRPPLASAPPPSPHDLNPRFDPPLDFPDRPFGELTPRDYDLLGFMCGLEVHQQLDTRRKLFCRCPSGRRMQKKDAEVLRHMRPTLSELGEYDGTALMEFKTQKEIVYLLERETVCTYEIDDTPPFEIDEQSVRIALEISKLLGLKLVSELQVMRKQYLDGSIPTGFQRTAMVGIDGVIPFTQSELGRDRQLRIRQLTLEEDSCREVSDVGHRITFVTDRLGTPLTETVTEPDLLTPRDVATGGRLLAAVAHASGKVRRGPGAARQDVNVSVAGGRRVELKGVSQHKVLPRLVHNEAFRQLNLLRIRAELARRGVREGMLRLADADAVYDSGLVCDARSVLEKSGFSPVTDALARGEHALAVKLTGFAGLLAHRTQPGLTFASEIADRVRVIACLTGQPFMLASNITDFLGPSVWQKLRAALGASDDDAVVVLWGPEDDLDTAAREVLARAREALVGVPSETRQAFPNGTTGFERILPGPERMYPDTDTPPVPIVDRWLQEIDAGLAEVPWQREERYVALGLEFEEARQLVDAPWADLFDALEPHAGDEARLVARALQKRLVQRFRETGRRELPAAARLRPLVEALRSGSVRAEAFETLLVELLQDDAEPAEIIARRATGGDDALRLAELALEVARRQGEVASDDPAATLRWAMGIAMRELLGKLDPARVAKTMADALGLEEEALEAS